MKIEINDSKNVTISIDKDGKVMEISHTCKEGWVTFYNKLDTATINAVCEKKQPAPKDGEIWFVKTKAGNEYVFVSKDGEFMIDRYFTYATNKSKLFTNTLRVCDDDVIYTLRPATPKEIALLHTKLKENGKVWNPNTKTLEDYRELREGELCIGWNKEKKDAIIGVLNAYRGNNRLYDHAYLIGTYGFSNAIPFESIEQFNEFRKS